MCLLAIHISIFCDVSVQVVYPYFIELSVFFLLIYGSFYFIFTFWTPLVKEIIALHILSLSFFLRNSWMIIYLNLFENNIKILKFKLNIMWNTPHSSFLTFSTSPWKLLIKLWELLVSRFYPSRVFELRWLVLDFLDNLWGN